MTNQENPNPKSKSKDTRVGDSPVGRRKLPARGEHPLRQKNNLLRELTEFRRQEAAAEKATESNGES